MKSFFLQDNYLIQVEGDMQDGLLSEEGTTAQTQGNDSQKRVTLMVHPSVDTDESSLR